MSSRTRTNFRSVFSACVVAGVYAAQAAAGGGPVSKYYMTTGDGDKVIRAQGSNYIERPTADPDNQEYPMYVLGTMRTVGTGKGERGSGYDKNLVFNGRSYTNKVMPAGSNTSWDATTDGCFLYAVNFDTGKVVRATLGWKNPQVLFDAGANFLYSMITYDPSNHSLWLSQWEGTMIENRDMQGNLLSSFDVGHDWITCLALDHKTGTLWIGDDRNHGVFEGYTRAGVLVGSIDYGFDYYAYGGEFDLGTPAKIKSVKVRKGEYLEGVRSDMNNCDTKRYRIRSESRRNGSSWMMCDIKFKSTVSNPDELDIMIESRLNTTGGTCKVYVKNWNTGRWDRVDSFAMSTSDSRETTYKVDATDYVNSNGITTVRLRQSTPATQNPGWKSYLNVVQVRVRE